jgi:type IV pilus assembly protein PilY1
MKKSSFLLLPLIGILLTLPHSVSIAGKCSVPPFVSANAPPIVLLVMERDHKIYYEAYNDASDLDKDGQLDVGYKHSIDYWGYFDPYKCYTYDSPNNRFNPTVVTATKYCAAGTAWSGNFLNWLSMSRMDVFRKVLYGGTRSTDSNTTTVLQGAYIPQDAHSWGKEYNGTDYNQLTPIPTALAAGRRHLFCMTSIAADTPHLIRVAQNSTFHRWNWASTERPVCSDYSQNDHNATRYPVGVRAKGAAANQIQDYRVAVKVCDSTIGLEDNCKPYPNGNKKPTGLLQKYGEGDGIKVCSMTRKACTVDANCTASDGVCIDKANMYFGLMTGSYTKNMSGGILRKNIYGMNDEVKPNSGTFDTSAKTEGNIIRTVDNMKVVAFDYSSFSYGNSTAGGPCGWITTRELHEGECRMWGNPVGEMMYEGLRYLAGNATATSQFLYSTPLDANGTVDIPKPTWGINKSGTYRQPYQMFPPCTKPTIIVLSDINNSYDSDQVPGAYTGFAQAISTSLSGMNATGLMNSIWTGEGLTGNYFVGESGSLYDFLCTSKAVSNFSSIRGLCPEEPTKRGSFTPAAMAYYGNTRMSNQNVSNVTTMVVGLASPVQDIKLKVYGKNVRLVPIGKSVIGCLNVGTSCSDKRTLTYDGANKGLTIGGCITAGCTSYCPSNQIVDFYVRNVTYDNATGGNMTYAKFDINFEDVEQGADHDMDAIVSYTLKPGATANTLNVTLDSTYAAGCIGQAMGFVISGTDADGTYLPVRDVDRCSGACTGTNSAVFNNMPLHWSRLFNLGGTVSNVLHEPLWYAAKWGGFHDRNQNGRPDQQAEWDVDGDGVPDNYFYVANPSDLWEALDRAFSLVLQRQGSAGAVATVTQEVQQEDVVVRAAFESYAQSNPSIFSWAGHMESFSPYNGCAGSDNATCRSLSGCTWNNAAGTCSGSIYSFQLTANQIPQNLFCADALYTGDHCVDAGNTLNATAYTARDIRTYVAGAWTPLTSVPSSNFTITTGVSPSTLVAWVRGSDANATLRNRDGWKLGDIVYSTPVVVGPANISSLPRPLVTSAFRTYVTNNQHRDQMVYVGANDGMLHAFDLGFWDNSTSPAKYVFDTNGTSSFIPFIGRERWAYIPSNLLSELQYLAQKSYGTTGGCQHRTMVDLSPQSWDVDLNGTGAWRSVLLGGERGGGDTYFALDVTNPTTPSVLWEYSVLKNYPANATVVNAYTSASYYPRMKILPLTWSVPYVGRLKEGTGKPYMAFIGGGIREFEPGLAAISANGTTKLTDLGGAAKPWSYLYYPTFHALNMQNGTDMWKSTWQSLLANPAYRAQYPGANATPHPFPYAVANVVAFDLFDSAGRSVETGGLQDGLTDLIYGGDTNGSFYTLIMAGNGTATPSIPTCMLRRKVRTVPATFVNSYRGKRQPITVTPVAALDNEQNLRVFFGTGKFDDVAPSITNDKTDNASMTFYCLKDSLTTPLQDSSRCNGTQHLSAPLNFTTKCAEDANASVKYNWTKLVTRCSVSLAACTTNADCGASAGLCQNATIPDGGSCFECMLDLTQNKERVIDSALVAGGYVFFTTFVPSDDVCSSGGNGYLYVLDYKCGALNNPNVIQQGGGTINYYNTQTRTWTTTAPTPTTNPNFTGGVRVNLGAGMPSRPVLNSSGTSIFIQTSNARLLRVEVDLGAGGRSKIQGWTRED